MKSRESRPSGRNKLSHLLMRRALFVVVLDILSRFEGRHRNQRVALAPFFGRVEDAIRLVGNDVWLSIL